MMCFLVGTLISTDRGEVPIEKLAIGDLVLREDGTYEAIRWIGYRRYANICAFHSADLAPVRFRAGSLGGQLPRRDLYVSAPHSMYISGALIPAHCLVNGTSITRDVTVPEIAYFHIELASHRIIYAEGVPTETFVDDGNRRMFDNFEEFAALQLEPSHNERFAPVVESGPLLKEIKRNIDALADQLALSPIPPVAPYTSTCMETRESCFEKRPEQMTRQERLERVLREAARIVEVETPSGFHPIH